MSTLISLIHFCKNVNVEVKNQLHYILAMGECTQDSTYLGMLFCKGKSKMKAFIEFMEKVKRSFLVGNKEGFLKQEG